MQAKVINAAHALQGSKRLLKVNREILKIILAVLGTIALPFADPLKEVDLASNIEWQLRVDGGAYRSIKVPGGGFNSDMQDKPYICCSIHGNGLTNDVTDNVEYKRQIQIPNVVANQVTLLEFGSVNHGCEVFLDGTKVGEHHGPNMPFAIDITDKVTPGNSYELSVKAYPQWHYGDVMPMGFYYTEVYDTRVTWISKGWQSRMAFGIAKYVKIAVYPSVYISDVFVRPSVSNKNLYYDVWVKNHTTGSKTVSLEGRLSSWNNHTWAYPGITGKSVSVNADTQQKITVGPIAWELGPKSYWWPNKPFRENYIAELHNLSLSVKEGQTVLDTVKQRFGFVEWGEKDIYYTVNGLRVNHISDATPECDMSHYDCYSNSPAFLPPTGPNTGCPETWKRFMRIGINTNRVHQATPTRYMMDVADEAGFMLIPESGIRGGGHSQTWHNEYMPQNVKDLAQACKNHPSTCRYSLSNEWFHETRLIDAIVTVDNTHPLVFEGQTTFTKYTGASGYHAYMMPHYTAYPKPATVISGIGEDETTGNGMEKYCWKATDCRYWDVAYYAGWCWMNYWPNFLQGTNYALHAFKAMSHADRVDGTDGWNSPVIKWVQQNFHPYLVMDYALHTSNTTFSGTWPAATSTYTSGASVSRNLVIFNDGYLAFEKDTNNFKILWEGRWGSATGNVAAAGKIDDIKIKHGFHGAKSLTFTAPSLTSSATPLEPDPGDVEVFKDDRVYYNVSSNKLYMVMYLYLKGDTASTGIHENIVSLGNQQKQAVSLFTVVNGRFSVPQELINKKADMYVYDIKGRLLHQAVAVNPSVDLQNNFIMTEGVYIVRIKPAKK